MYQLFLALLLACASPAQYHHHNNGDQGTVVALDTDPVGDHGHFPPPPPPPPH